MVLPLAAPPSNNSGPPETECLLVLAPGFGIPASDMRRLAETAQVSPDNQVAVCNN
jgi:hypothetical protein